MKKTLVDIDKEFLQKACHQTGFNNHTDLIHHALNTLLELKDGPERYRSILEQIQEGYYEVDLAGNFTFFTIPYASILGYSPEEMVGMNYRRYIDRENARNVQRVFSEVYHTGMPARVVYEQMKKNGDKLFVETSVTLMRDSSGQPVGFRGIVHDVSERKRMEDALEESEKKYRSILENIEEGYYEVDLKGNLQFFNRALHNILGYTEEEMKGMNYRQCMNAETAKTTFLAFNEVYRTGIPTKHLDWELINKDGGSIIVETSVAPLKDVSGKLIGFRGVTHDVTTRKQMEEEIKRLSITDPLTGLYNRRGFLTLSEQQLKISMRLKKGSLLVFADLDDLKIINDTLGHRKGDEALIEAAAIFREVFRQSDIIARMGGDEFAILALETSSSPRGNPAVLTERLQRCIDLHNARVNRDYAISMSIGIVSHGPDTVSFIDELMSQADALMYEQKRRKRKEHFR